MLKSLGVLLVFLNLGLCVNNSHTFSSIEEEDCHFCKDEKELYDLIMDYRKSKGLDEIPVSKALSIVAHSHAMDLNLNFDASKESCNTHSWSESDVWKKCCYSSDHSNPECMWYKPRELTYYEGNGYEIVVSRTGSHEGSSIKPEAALNSWKKSSGHNDVILNKSIWKDLKWQSIGIGIEGDYACVWFGEETDKFGGPAECNAKH